MTTRPTALLVPGAWMAAWIWEPTVTALRERGIDARTLTLRGLEQGLLPTDIARVTLEEHVTQLLDQLSPLTQPAVLVSHSYAAMVTASAADRAPGQVAGLIHLGGFLPADGRSLLDDWGSSAADRAAERAHVEAVGMLWPAPTPHELAYEPRLTAEHRELLLRGFTPHPGRTVTEPACLARPVETQATTYVTLTPTADDDVAWQDAPQIARGAASWRRKHLPSGHWPMLSEPGALLDLLEAEIRHYAERTR